MLLVCNCFTEFEFVTQIIHIRLQVILTTRTFPTTHLSKLVLYFFTSITRTKPHFTLINLFGSNWSEVPHWIKLFKQQAPNILLPPSPVLTRWETLIEAATYHGKNYEIIIKLCKSQALCVKDCQEVLQNAEVVQNLIIIPSTFPI